MPELRDRHEGGTLLGSEPTRARPVVLATMSVRVDPTAERMAIDSALEAGVPLVIANVLPLRPYPTTFALVGPEGLNLPHEEDLDAVRATAQRAAAIGIDTKLLRVTTRRPVKAILEVLSDLDALRETAQRAADLGVKTELLRVRTRHAVRALLEVAHERDAGLLVFGPDLRLTSRRRFQMAARRVRRDAPCLVWVAPDG